MGWGCRRLYVAVLVTVLATTGVVGVGAASSGRTPVARRVRNAEARALRAVQPSYPAANIAAVRAEADWILTAQLPDGAIAHHVDKVRVLPYLASFASVGLTRASAVTGDPRYVRASWRWLSWYQAHQTDDGFVTDYTIQDGIYTSTGDMDSTDAYAGMFLYAAWSAWQQTRDRTALKVLRPGILRAVNAIEQTMDADGLTWAKPTWRVKYLMDQSEVYVGLRSASKLLQALKDPTSTSAEGRAHTLKDTIDTTWDTAVGAYDWAIHEDGARTSTTWESLYPDALQQVWAVAFGVSSSSHVEEIVNRFTTAHPYWSDPRAVAERAPGIEQYWPVAGWAMPPAVRDEAARSIGDAAAAAGRAWPYTPATAGQLIVLASGGPAVP